MYAHIVYYNQKQGNSNHERGKDMTKTLWCEKERTNMLEIAGYYKVTAHKIDELEAGVKNLYEDEDGNRYIVHYNKFKRREEFAKLG